MMWREKQAEGWRVADEAMELAERGGMAAATPLMDEANRLRTEALCEQPRPTPWIRETR